MHLLEYSIYLIRTTVSAMVAASMLFVWPWPRRDVPSGRNLFFVDKYRSAHLGVALAALLDLCMDISGCWMISHDFEFLHYHWAWAVVFYVQWTVLGICVLQLVESKHRFYWFPPLLLYYVIMDSEAYYKRIDDVYSGRQNVCLHELSYMAPSFYLIYLSLTLLSLMAWNIPTLEAFLHLLSSLAAMCITLRIFTLRHGLPDTLPVPEVVELNPTGEKENNIILESMEMDNVATRVAQWEQRPDKPYCHDNITLYVVANELRLTPRLLSYYLNSIKMVNFNTWINGLRVNEIERLIGENPSADLYDLMIGSGFQSRASLARAVKSVTGMTVSQLKEKRNQN